MRTKKTAVPEVVALVAHRLAGLFPLIEGAEFAELVADIKAHGVREAIWLYDGQILDGRNRYRAAQAAGVECPSRTYRGGDALSFVVSANLHRRHLDESQRAMVAADLANMRQGERTDLPSANLPKVSQHQAAAMLSVGARSIRYAKEVRKKDEAVADLVKRGTINLHQARKLAALPDDGARKIAVKAVSNGADFRAAFRAARKRGYNARIEAAKPKPLHGTYRILYADPPWKYHGLNEVDEHGHAEAHYNCLDDDQLIEFRPDGKRLVKELADDNSVLFCWVTSPLLERCFPILRAWGFAYKSSFVWDKVKHNMAHYNSMRHELLLIATKGTCTPDVPKLIDSVQVIERSAKHSEKPEEFRQIIEAMYDHGRKLQLFGRIKRPGWDVVGNEVYLRAAA